MKIKLDNNNYLEVDIYNDDLVSLSIKARRDEGSVILVTAYLDSRSLDDLISNLVSVRPKVKDE
jgi:hypothetical protein